MAKHRTTRQRRTRKAFITAAAAAGLSGTLMFAHALDGTAAQLDPRLAAAAFGIGGRGDATSANVGNKLEGKIGLPVLTGQPGFTGPITYVPVLYPADFNFQNSTDQGVTYLEPRLATASGPVEVIAYSEGTLVAEQVKRDLADNPGSRSDVTFLLVASPYVPNGGLFGRFPGFGIPGVVPTFSTAQPTQYDSTYVTNEYDPYADFPAYFNPLSLANSLAAVEYAHPDQYYDNIDPNAANGNYKTTVTNNGAGGTDTYILVYNPQLPLFGPIRQLEAAVPQLTPVVEPLVSAVEPLTRVLVDMGYTDRTNDNPATPTSFSLITPPAKIIEAAEQVPGAIGQGVQNLIAGHDVTPIPQSQSKTEAGPGQPATPDPSPLAKTPTPLIASSPASDPVTPDQTKPDATKPDAPKSPPKNPAAGLDKLVNQLTHPKLTLDGNKASPTTKAPAFGRKSGGNNLLKTLFGGGSTPDKSAPSADTGSPAPNSADSASSPAA